jgi:hypothetical protein
MRITNFSSEYPHCLVDILQRLLMSAQLGQHSAATKQGLVVLRRCSHQSMIDLCGKLIQT